ncbi:MAG: Asp23/Gls24 family envelope stress response protein [Clostridia bacterium]|nr:Asp23/Gls24 family envelope stress response protein [Clostridia bacterium]
MSEIKNGNENITGKVNISEEVVSIISSQEARTVKGVVGMMSSLTGGFAEFLGKKNLSKGVKVEFQENNIIIDLFIIIEYGAIIQDVASIVQDRVKAEVESMTGLNVVAVNVNVEGVVVPENKEEATEE